jgi:ABC-2 type transport system permease protein
MKYLRIIFILYKAAVMRDLEYRASYLSMLVANLAWTNFALISILLISKNIPMFGGWTQDELLILTGCWMLLNFLMFSFVYGNMRRLAKDIFNGNLDFFLLKPIDTQFLVTTQRFAIGAMGSLIEGVALLSFVFSRGSLTLTIENLLGFLVLLFIGACLYYSFYVINASINIISPLADNLVFVVPEVANISKFPNEAFPKFVSVVLLTIIPVMLLTVFPAKMLMGRLSWQEFLLTILIAGIFFFGSRRLWSLSLRHYSSASS